MARLPDIQKTTSRKGVARNTPAKTDMTNSTCKGRPRRLPSDTPRTSGRTQGFAPTIWYLLLVSLTLTLTLTLSSFAYWPMSVEENLLVSPGPDTSGWNCQALPYPDNSTLVVYKQGWTGMVYQIIDQYGQFKYPSPVELAPESGFGLMYGPYLISDGLGGAIVCWNLAAAPQAIYAQRVDSLGNLMWGNAGITIFPFNESDYDISPDGEGGFLIAIAIDEPNADWTDLYVQRIDGVGNLLWGENGIEVTALPVVESRYPVITHDGAGGCFVVWEDSRPPYSYWGALYAQHLDGNGNILWPEDLFICEHVWGHYVIPDGEGGFILQSNPGPADFNTHWRIDGEGNILWERDHLSWYYWADMVVGEPGFFYLGFVYGFGTYGQRMDMEGNNYWPSWPESIGAEMAFSDGNNHNMHESFFYADSQFYGVLDYRHGNDHPYRFYFQKLDIDGNRIFADNGILIAAINDGNWMYANSVPDNTGGVVLTFERTPAHDIYAKHCNADGTLGGPLPPVENVIISVSGSDIVLTWPVMAPMAEYSIYKAIEPYIFPAEPDTSVMDTTFIDVNGILEGAGYYNVRWEPR